MNKLIKKETTVRIISGSRRNQQAKVISRKGDRLVLNITKLSSKKTTINYTINISNVILIKT